MPAEQPQCRISTVGEEEITTEAEDPHPCAPGAPWVEMPKGHPRDWGDFLRRYCAGCHLS